MALSYKVWSSCRSTVVECRNLGFEGNEVLGIVLLK